LFRQRRKQDKIITIRTSSILRMDMKERVITENLKKQ